MGAGPRSSTTFAGYQAKVAGPITVKTSFTVPSAACTTGFQASNLAVGSGSGKSRETIGLLIECNGAGPASYATWVLYNKFKGGPSNAIWTNCCTAGGHYFEDCHEAAVVDAGVSATGGFGVAAYALDPDAATRLWDVSIDAVAAWSPIKS